MQEIVGIGFNPLFGIQGVAAGGLMLYRGATGVCPVYKCLGKETTDPKAINITEDIVVDAPIDKVHVIQHVKDVYNETIPKCGKTIGLYPSERWDTACG